MIRVTDHAIARYIERVKPALDWSTAKGELLMLIRQAPAPRVWDLGHDDEHEGELVTELAPGINAVLTPDQRTVVTVLTHSMVTAEKQAKRAEKKRRRRARRRPGLYRAGRPAEKTSW